MKQKLQWNPHTDQPDNVAPRNLRFRHHFSYIDGYFSLILSNLKVAVPVLFHYRKNRKKIFRIPNRLSQAFAVASSPSEKKNSEVAACLKDLGVSQSLIRIPSWELDRLSEYEDFFGCLGENQVETMLVLIQQRKDVLNPGRWEHFIDKVFSRFAGKCTYFEIGHAWNRTKWGIWDYREYLELAQIAFSAAKDYKVKLVGPAVIDFEFHLYPPVLRKLPFHKISSLLYVDRVGSPENTQFGWDAAGKIALLRSIIDVCLSENKGLWITEMNWPLKGTGKYNPAPGRASVSENRQASYLVRYFVLSFASGFVEKIYWWQLAAPGYGLIDSRGNSWRKRPAYFAMKTLVSLLEGSIFEGKFVHPRAEVFIFCRLGQVFAVGWSKGKPLEYNFPSRVKKVLNRDGITVPFSGSQVRLDGSPRYVFFDENCD